MAFQRVVHVLDASHDIQVSLKALKCKLKTMKLIKSQILLIKLYTRQSNVNLKGHLYDMDITSCGISYIWNSRYGTHGIQVRRSKVLKILPEEDPAGTLLRKSRHIKRRVYICDCSNNTW